MSLVPLQIPATGKALGTAGWHTGRAMHAHVQPGQSACARQRAVNTQSHTMTIVIQSARGEPDWFVPGAHGLGGVGVGGAVCECIIIYELTIKNALLEK